MIKLFKYSTTTAAILISISLTGCSSFDTRMQANDDFDYQNTNLVSTYKHGKFSNDEARNNFNIPTLTKSQKKAGLLNEMVDIRPPTQFIPIIDGVSLVMDPQHTKILFNATNPNIDLKAKIWQRVNDYFVANNIAISSKNESLKQLETGIYSQKEGFGGFLNHREILKKASYRIALEEQVGNHSIAIKVDLLSYAEINDGSPLKFIFTDKSKKNVELQFVNDLLEFMSHEKQSMQSDQSNRNPLTVKLGFDDNHQISWIAESDFSDTWEKLPDLLTLLNFVIIEKDRNLGTISLEYSSPSNDYWRENNLSPFELDNGSYSIQLGDIDKHKTSIYWFGKDKITLPVDKVTDIYLSISDKMRAVILQKDKQSHAL